MFLRMMYNENSAEVHIQGISSYVG